jgi:hypothetical protein
VTNLSVGVLAAAVTSFEIEVGRQGQSRLVAPDGRARMYPTFLKCLVSVSALLSTLTNERGLIDEGGWSLESEMNSLIGSAN